VTRRLVKRSYFEALRLLRADTRALRRHAANDDLLVLNFHSVSPESNPYGPSLHPEAFAELLGWLTERARVVSLRDLPLAAHHDTTRPPVVLSFDDGLKDFVDHAMPVLASFGAVANLNIIGAALETGEAPWAIALVDLLGASPPAAVMRLRVPGFADSLTEDAPSAKERYAAALTNHFKRLAPDDRDAAWAAVNTTLQAVTVERPTAMMSSDDVATAAAAGHEIGSHSYSHESMEHLDDDAFLQDLRRSRELLARAGVQDCTVYAFPNGSHRPGQSELLLAEGIRHVLLVDERPSRPEAFVHPRLTVRGDSAAELRARAAHGIGIAA
jgi:peptidoglycan/xylan/chitin deacetylase (PgdA/CDA1 family)